MRDREKKKDRRRKKERNDLNNYSGREREGENKEERGRG